MYPHALIKLIFRDNGFRDTKANSSTDLVAFELVFVGIIFAY